jgi:hypothetical protein
MTPSRRAGLCVLLSLARSSGDIVELADAPVTVTPGTYYKYTEKFSVITKDDCHIAAHDTYTSVAVGGNLYDAACGQSKKIDSKESKQTAFVAGTIGVYDKSCYNDRWDSPYLQDCQNCGSLPDLDGERQRKSNLGLKVHDQNGQGKEIEKDQNGNAASLPFDWESFEDMVCAMPTRTYTDGQFRVHVVDQGSNFGYDRTGTEYKGEEVDDGMSKNEAQYNTDSKGCIVVYKGSNSVILGNGGDQNNKWVCSVLAPFATVIYKGKEQNQGGPGYIDGNIVARTFTVRDDKGSQGQLHGHPYQGPFPALEEGVSCSGKPDYGFLDISPPPPSPPPSVPPPSFPDPPMAPPPPRWGAQHCITNADTGKHACVVLPLGHDINSDTDPQVKRAKDLAFRLEPMGNTVYTPPSD